MKKIVGLLSIFLCAGLLLEASGSRKRASDGRNTVARKHGRDRGPRRDADAFSKNSRSSSASSASRRSRSHSSQQSSADRGHRNRVRRAFSRVDQRRREQEKSFANKQKTIQGFRDAANSRSRIREDVTNLHSLVNTQQDLIQALSKHVESLEKLLAEEQKARIEMGEKAKKDRDEMAQQFEEVAAQAGQNKNTLNYLVAEMATVKAAGDEVRKLFNPSVLAMQCVVSVVGEDE